MQFNTADMDLKQSDSALVPGPKAFHLCSAFISQRGSSRWGNQMHSVSQWQQTGQPSCLLLQLVKFICQFFESGLGSSTSTQLGHKEGGEAEESVSWIAGSYSIVIFFEKEKNRCILGNPWLPMRESQAHTHSPSAMVVKTHTTQGHWGQEGGRTTVKLEKINLFAVPWRKMGVAGEKCFQERQQNRWTERWFSQWV